jgi:hypothetical protein
MPAPLASEPRLPSLGPHVYHLKPGWIAFFLLGGLGSLGGPIATALFELWAAAPFFATFGVSCLLLMRTRVRLDDHSIAFHTGFSERSLDRASIVARRILQYQYCQVLELLTGATGARSLKIPLLLRFDADFEGWLASLRNLDAEEKGAVLAELASSHDP